MSFDDLDEWLAHLADEPHEFVTRQEFHHAIERIRTAMSTSEQAVIDAITAEITTAASNIEAEIAALAAAHPAADLTALKAAADSLAAIAPTPAPAPAPAPTPAPAPEPTPAPVATATVSVYTFDGDPSTVDVAQWTKANIETTDTPPKSLYFYGGDTAPGMAAGDGLGGVWHLYSGATQPVTAPAPEPQPAPVTPAPGTPTA